MRAMADTGALKRLFLILVASVVVLDAIMIGGYYALHVGMRTMKTQQTYVAVWVVLTLIVVTTMMKRIRAARRRR
jgi:multidrug resistance efflux pump